MRHTAGYYLFSSRSGGAGAGAMARKPVGLGASALRPAGRGGRLAVGSAQLLCLLCGALSLAGGCASLDKRCDLPSAYSRRPGTDRSAACQPAVRRADLDMVACPSTTTSQAERVLDELECVEAALSNHRRRDIAAYRLQIAEAQLKQAESAFWPQVSATASATHLDDDTEFVVGEVSGIELPDDLIKIKTTGKDFAGGSLDVVLPLYTGGRRTAYLDMARAARGIAEQGRRLTDMDLVRVARRTYYAVLFTKQLLTLGHDTQARFGVTLELTERLYQAGSQSVDKTDYLRTRVIVANIDAFVAELEASHTMARAALANAIGEAWDVEVDVAEPELKYAPRAREELDRMVADAYAFRPDWQQLEEAVGIAEAQVRLAHGGHLPQVALVASVYHLRDEYNAGVVTPNGDGWTVGVYAQIPLFRGFRTVNEVREAKARLAVRHTEQMLFRDAIGLQIKDAFVRLQRARNQVEATLTAVELAEENRALNERAYQSELVETKDVIEAQLLETFTKAQHLKALYDWHVALVELDYFVGREVEQIAENIAGARRWGE
jgi:outer membrane protein